MECGRSEKPAAAVTPPSTVQADGSDHECITRTTAKLVQDTTELTEDVPIYQVMLGSCKTANLWSELGADENLTKGQDNDLLVCRRRCSTVLYMMSMFRLLDHSVPARFVRCVGRKTVRNLLNSRFYCTVTVVPKSRRW